MLSDEEQRELLTKMREIHAAMLARRALNAGTKANHSESRNERKTAATSTKHDPNNPVVKVLPKNWKGDDLRGRRYSECPPNFLGMLSHMLDSFAMKNEEDPERQKYARWDRENAEAARRWRAKLELFDKPMGEAAF